jgi:hypothetical protein
MRYVSVETELSVFTTITSGQRNPKGVIRSRQQQQFSINVWAGTVDHCLVSPHVLPHQLQATTTGISSYMICQSYWKIEIF